VLSLDLAAIMAGSGVRGQFEEKFKALLRDIEAEAGNVICFIDEVRAYSISAYSSCSRTTDWLTFFVQTRCSTSGRLREASTLGR
jgi:hypothetical protein